MVTTDTRPRLIGRPALTGGPGRGDPPRPRSSKPRHARGGTEPQHRGKRHESITFLAQPFDDDLDGLDRGAAIPRGCRRAVGVHLRLPPVVEVHDGSRAYLVEHTLGDPPAGLAETVLPGDG